MNRALIFLTALLALIMICQRLQNAQQQAELEYWKLNFKQAFLGQPTELERRTQVIKELEEQHPPQKAEEQEGMAAAIRALEAEGQRVNEPIEKAWAQFEKDVEVIRSEQYQDSSLSRILGGPAPSHRDMLVWCDRALDAIQRRDFAVFNYLTQQLPKDYLPSLHYPDLKMPGLRPADIESLSRFIRPENNPDRLEHGS